MDIKHKVTAGPAEGATAWWWVVGRVVSVVVVYLVAWAGLDVVATHFQAEQDVSVWYPPPALDVVLLLVFGLRYIPALALSPIIHVTLVNSVGLDVLHVAVFDMITTAGYAGAVWVLLRVVHIDPRLPSQRDVMWLVSVACGAGTLFVATAQVTLLATAGAVSWGQWPLSVAGYWAGSATGIAMLAPFLLLTARRWSGRRTGGWPTTWTRRPAVSPHPPGLSVSRREMLAQLLVLGGAVYAAYGSALGASLDYTYLVYAPLLWIAVRGGLRAAALAVPAANIGAVALNGGRIPADGGIVLQFGLVTLTLIGLLLGSVVTQRRANSDRHRYNARHDPLTGLGNRALFTDELSAALDRGTDNPPQRFAVLMVDLDNFKQVNDSLGHRVGDQLLTDVAHRLDEVTPSAATIARLGGDEFAVLLTDLTDPTTELAAVANRILTTLARPHHLTDNLTDTPTPVVVTTSIGSALPRIDPSEHSNNTADLLRCADVALHHAKRRGSNQHATFTAAMHSDARTALQRETALRQALENHDLTIAFQPVVDLTNADSRTPPVLGWEALTRWTPPGGTAVPPETFIALAEDAGLIVALGEQVLRSACQIAATWHPTNSTRPRLAVNASPQELAVPGYCDRVLAILADTGLPADRLDIEITETHQLGQSPTIRRTLTELADAGIGLLIDDFGTGYSSFFYLSELPITGLKIDRALVTGLPHHRQNAVIVQAILAMTAELNLPVIAEGVETTEQLRFLQQHRCSYAQGFLFGRPTTTPTLDQ